MECLSPPNFTDRNCHFATGKLKITLLVVAESKPEAEKTAAFQTTALSASVSSTVECKVEHNCKGSTGIQEVAESWMIYYV